MFDKNWHKIHFGVFRDRVTLYVDCEYRGEHPLEVRGPLETNGNITVSKLVSSTQTVPVGIQRYILLLQLLLLYLINICRLICNGW